MTISVLDDGIFPRKFHFSFKEFDFSRKFNFRQNFFTLKCNYNIKGLPHRSRKLGESQEKIKVLEFIKKFSFFVSFLFAS